MAPRKDTPPPGTGPSEKEVLRGYLDYLRDSVIHKLDDLSEDDARAPGVESGTNLLGLVRHLAFVERFRFLADEPGSWAATMRARKSDSIESVVADYRDTITQMDAVIEACADLGEDAPLPPGRTQGSTMRWAVQAVLHELARHAGHMDIIREQLDGRTGR